MHSLQRETYLEKLEKKMEGNVQVEEKRNLLSFNTGKVLDYSTNLVLIPNNNTNDSNRFFSNATPMRIRRRNL